MEKQKLLEELKEKNGMEYYARIVDTDVSALPMLLEIMETEKSAVKYQAEKVIRHVSEEKPELLYAYFERIADLLSSKFDIIKWGAILTLPNLLTADAENKWEKVRVKYLSSLKTEKIAEFGNIVSCVKKILKAHPEEEKEIVPSLLNIDSHVFIYHGEISPECVNVAKGHIIQCFTEIYPESEYKSEIVSFIKHNADNSRNQVRMKANKFLKRYADLPLG
jgi:hypothetical protein